MFLPIECRGDRSGHRGGCAVGNSCNAKPDYAQRHGMNTDSQKGDACGDNRYDIGCKQGESTSKLIENNACKNTAKSITNGKNANEGGC